MKSLSVSERQTDAHPVPRVFLIVRRLIRVSQEQECLHNREPIGFVVEIVQQLTISVSRLIGIAVIPDIVLWLFGKNFFVRSFCRCNPPL